MTVPSSRPVSCEKCKQETAVEQYESINSHDRHLHDKLVSGAVWKWRCAHCAHDNTMIYPLLYHDLRVWCLVYYLDRRMTDDPRVIAQLVPGAHQLTALRRFNSTYRFRLCRSLEEFIEKIHILDAGLDDRAVEYLKLRCRFPERAAKIAANDIEKALARAAMNARFERLIATDPKTLDFGPSPFASTSLERAFRTEIAFPAYEDALVKVTERVGSGTDADAGFVVVDQSYIEQKFPEAVPKSKDVPPPQEPAGDMGSVVFGKINRFNEARKPWWRFW
jgi:hypothetical protein